MSLLCPHVSVVAHSHWLWTPRSERGGGKMEIQGLSRKSSRGQRPQHNQDPGLTEAIHTPLPEFIKTHCIMAIHSADRAQ